MAFVRYLTLRISPVTDAYLYYFRCVIRNRFKSLVPKLKRPAYLVGAVVLVFYAVYLYRREFFASPLLLEAIYFGQLAVVWIGLAFGRNYTLMRTLGFRQSEIQQLFAAPVSRRRLLQFKVMQNQWGILLGALIFSTLCRGIEGASFGRLFIGVWIIGNIANLHASLATFLQRYLFRHGWRALCWVVIVAFAAWVLYALWLAVSETVAAAAEPQMIYQHPALQQVLWPVQILLAPALSASYGEMLQVLWVPLLVWLVHALIFFNARFRFEDEAVATAESIDAFKREGWAALRQKNAQELSSPRFRWRRLAPTGAPWRALVWKNFLSIARLQPGQMRRLVMLITLATVVAAFLDARLQFVVAAVLVGGVFYSILLGPALIRVDLRIDIPHFDVLKAMPISGRQLIFGEIMGSHLALFWLQGLAIVAAAILWPDTDRLPLSAGDKSQAAVVLLAVVFALTFFLFTLQNLMALYLPSFVRMGRSYRPNFDQFGSNILGALIRMLGLLLALLPATAAGGVFGGITYYLLQPDWRWPVTIAALVGNAVLFVEAVLLIYVADARYRRFDLSSENIATDDFG